MSDEIETSFYDEYPEPQFKSKRLPDIHGGHSDASAEPDNRQSKKEFQQAHSNVVYQRRQEQIMESIHGQNPPRAHLPVLINIHNVNISILETLKSIQDFNAAQIPIGQIKEFEFNTSGMGFIHIDFADSTQTVKPASLVINEPNRKLTRLAIFNDGPGTIKFSTNLPKSDQTAETRINAGESFDLDYHDKPIIWSANLVAISGTPSIRGMYLF